VYGGVAGAPPSRPRDVRIGVLSLSFNAEDGSFCVLQADPYIVISDTLLEQAQGPNAHVEVGDGIVTFHTRHGDLSYGLLEHDELRECWLAVQAGWQEADEWE
jgi:hypothetical protein